MPKYKADKAAGEHHSIPDKERIVSQHTVAGVETIVTEEKEAFECEECGEKFYGKHAYWGHIGSHEETNE